jgi:hypothetical protein
MNSIGPTILLIAASSFVFVILDMDAIHVFIPPNYLNQPGVLLLRMFLQSMAEFEWATTLAQTHLVVITLILHTKSLFTQLALLKGRIVQLKPSQKVDGDVLTGLNDLQLYSLTNYFFTVLNQYMGFTIVFVLLPGFGLEVVANYMILQMYEQFPLYLYVFSWLLGIVVPTIIVMELPTAGENYDASVELLHGWKGKCRSRRSLRYKRVVRFRPIGYTMGGFFTFKKSTVTTFAEALMDYTINAILSF